MRITLDDEEILTLSEIQKKVIQNDIPSELFEHDMKRRLKYMIDHPCEHHIERNSDSWREELKKKNVSLYPSDKWTFANVLYQSRNYEPHDQKEMHVKVDGNLYFTVSALHKKLLSDSGIENPSEYVKERLAFILRHKYERCMERLRKEWEPRFNTVPIDDETFAQEVFAHPDYKNRSQRDAASPII